MGVNEAHKGWRDPRFRTVQIPDDRPRPNLRGQFVGVCRCFEVNEGGGLTGVCETGGFVTHGAHSALPDGLLAGGGFVRAENAGLQGIHHCKLATQAHSLSPHRPIRWQDF